MIECSFRVPVESWWFKNDVFEYMTLKNWLVCRGENIYVYEQFKYNLSAELNKISTCNKNEKSIWLMETDSPDVIIKLYTSNETINLPTFYEIVNTKIIPILRNLYSDGRLLVFTDKYIDKQSFKIVYTDKQYGHS